MELSKAANSFQNPPRTPENQALTKATITETGHDLSFICSCHSFSYPSFIHLTIRNVLALWFLEH